MTAHFAYPYFYAMAGIDLRQPIGGDFGLSAALAGHLLEQPVVDDVRGYGIDIFLSLHAARGGFRLSQASLERKLHKPSFPRRSRIFREVVGAALAVSGRLDASRHADESSSALPCSIDDAGEFVHRREAEALARLAQERAAALSPIYRRWLGGDHPGLRAVLDDTAPRLSADAWTDVLAGAIAAWRVASARGPAHELAGELDPLHLIRSVTFWNDCRAREADIVESEIVTQARLFRRKLLARCGSQGLTPRSA